MKKIIILSLVIALKSNADCILLKFEHVPNDATCAALDSTQRNTTAGEVCAWFKSGERGFILSDIHTNEIKIAIADGAKAKGIK